MRYLLTIVFAVVFASAAQASGPRRACEPSYMPRCQWITAGDAALEAVAARGEQTLRFDYSAYLRPEHRYSIEISRDRQGVVRIALHAPFVEATMASRIVASSAWPRFVALRARVIAENAAALERFRKENPRLLETHGGRVECFDPGMLSIGSALGGKAEQLELDACATSEVDRIADQIHDAAYGLLPYCAKMDETVGFGCGSLGGDGNVAASFAATVLATAGPCTVAERPPLASGARLEIADSPVLRGGIWRGRRLFTKLCHGPFSTRVDLIVADHGGLTVTGRALLRNNKSANPAFQGPVLIAPSVQVWRIDGGKAKLEHWTIGKFAPVEMEPPSPPPMPQ